MRFALLFGLLALTACDTATTDTASEEAVEKQSNQAAVMASKCMDACDAKCQTNQCLRKCYAECDNNLMVQ